MGYSADLWAHFAYSIALGDPPPLLLGRAKGRRKRRKKKELETAAVDHEGWAENFYYLLLRS